MVIAETQSGPIQGCEKDNVLLLAAFIGEGSSPRHVADAVHGSWTRFIRDGDPGYPPYSTARRETMVFDDTSGVVQAPDAEERAAWNGLR